MNPTIKYVVIGIILVIVVMIAGSFLNWTHQMYKESYRSLYLYEVEVKIIPDATLHNVTLYVPLPVFKGDSKIGDAIINESIRLPWVAPAIPYDWTPSIVETDYGEMLKITTDKIDPNTGMIIAVLADHDINTKRPIGNEPLLSPMYNLTKITTHEFQSPPPWAPYCYDIDDCYKYESRIYTDYTISNDANVSISIQVKGRNEWWVIGWSANHYDEAIGITLTGDQHGWQVTPGRLIQGGGYYSWLWGL